MIDGPDVEVDPSLRDISEDALGGRQGHRLRRYLRLILRPGMAVSLDPGQVRGGPLQGEAVRTARARDEFDVVQMDGRARRIALVALILHPDRRDLELLMTHAISGRGEEREQTHFRVVPFAVRDHARDTAWGREAGARVREPHRVVGPPHFENEIRAH